MSNENTPVERSKRGRWIVLVALVVVAGSIAGGVWLLRHDSKRAEPTPSIGGTSNPSPSFVQSEARGAQVAYPDFLTKEAPNPDDHVVFLAERAATGGEVGTTMLVRSQPGVGADFTKDVHLLDALENLTHAQRRVDYRHDITVRGATNGYVIVARFPDSTAAGHLVRKADIVARTADGRSYHVVLVGSPDRITDELVNDVANGLKL